MAVKKTSKGDKVVLPKSLVTGVQTGGPATGKSPGNVLTDGNTNYFNKSMRDVRQASSTMKAIRLLARLHGDVSAAVSATVRLANTPLKITAYDAAHQLSDEGTALCRSILARIDNVNDYSKGYDDRPSLAGAIESLLREVDLSGACAMELVLDEQRLPYSIRPISVQTLKWKVSETAIGGGEAETYKLAPQQRVLGKQIELDIPTFFYAALDQDPEQAYSTSPLEPSVNTSLFSSEIFEDVRRVVRRSGHSRLVVTLLHEKLVAAAPANVRTDPAKLADWIEEQRLRVKDEIEALAPESSLILIDTVEAAYLNSEIGASADYNPLIEAVDGQLSTSLKTPPSVLGKRIGGSQNTSSTESLLFLKTAAGVQPPVQTVLSRALTLAVRMFGFDGYVKVQFEPIDLRPETETEAFQSMKQARILELLSLGFMTDQEAAEHLGSGPRAAGAPKLSGTMFLNGTTSAQQPAEDGSDPARRALTTDAPKASGGKGNSPGK